MSHSLLKTHWRLTTPPPPLLHRCVHKKVTKKEKRARERDRKIERERKRNKQEYVCWHAVVPSFRIYNFLVRRLEHFRWCAMVPSFCISTPDPAGLPKLMFGATAKIDAKCSKPKMMERKVVPSILVRVYRLCNNLLCLVKWGLSAKSSMTINILYIF